MTLAATSRPIGSELPRNMGLKAGMSQATPSAATNPPNMAAPPRVGVGLRWTRRASGFTTAPSLTAIFRTSGVSPQVTRAATAQTRMYSAMPAGKDRTSGPPTSVFAHGP